MPQFLRRSIRSRILRTIHLEFHWSYPKGIFDSLDASCIMCNEAIFETPCHLKKLATWLLVVSNINKTSIKHQYLEATTWNHLKAVAPAISPFCPQRINWWSFFGLFGWSHAGLPIPPPTPGEGLGHYWWPRLTGHEICRSWPRTLQSQLLVEMAKGPGMTRDNMWDDPA